MLMVAKKNMKFFVVSLLINLKSVLVYKTSFLVQSIFMVINNSFLVIFWIKIFQNGNEITAFSFNDILSLWSISALAYGITYFFFGGVLNINRYIIDCTMDSYMLQPKSILLNIILSKSDFSAFGDMLFGIIIIVISHKENLFDIILLIFFGIFGSIFFLSTEIIMRSISVWIGDTEKLSERYIHTLLTNFSVYPEQIFPKWIRAILYTIVPAGLLSYLPINLLSNFSILKISIYFICAIIYLFIAIFVFNLAIRNYNSGNCFSLKI